MLVVLERKQPVTAGRLAKPLLLMCAVFYLALNAVHGERGLYALIREKRELASLQQEYIAVKMQREAMERRVVNLRSGSLDLDLLDEQMRRMLGVTRSGEMVILQ